MTSRPGWPPTHLPVAVQGTAVSAEGRGALLIGPTGSGKSSIALQMIALGARLVSDDIVWLEQNGGVPWLSYPPQAPQPPRIEARGLGLIPFDPVPPAPLLLVVDLGRMETARLPRNEMVEIAGTRVRCCHKVDNPAFHAMVLQYLLRAVPWE
jgi:HPr kinase/phosphorylase